MINCNPETVSTDYDISDRLYFEPLTLEDVLGVLAVERNLEGVIVQFGGQTPLKLAAGLERAGVRLLGTSVEAIDLAEDRTRFGALLDRLGYQAPPYATRRAPSRRRWRKAERGRLPAARAPLLRARRTGDGDRRTPSGGSPTTFAASSRRRGRRAPMTVAAVPRASSSTASSSARSRSTSTRSATARAMPAAAARCGSAGSCSTSRRPACTPATAPACCRRTRSTRR